MSREQERLKAEQRRMMREAEAQRWNRLETAIENGDIQTILKGAERYARIARHHLSGMPERINVLTIGDDDSPEPVDLESEMGVARAYNWIRERYDKSSRWWHAAGVLRLALAMKQRPDKASALKRPLREGVRQMQEAAECYERTSRAGRGKGGTFTALHMQAINALLDVEPDIRPPDLLNEFSIDADGEQCRLSDLREDGCHTLRTISVSIDQIVYKDVSTGESGEINAPRKPSDTVQATLSKLLGRVRNNRSS